jgi:hypothetical protein
MNANANAASHGNAEVVRLSTPYGDWYYIHFLEENLSMGELFWRGTPNMYRSRREAEQAAKELARKMGGRYLGVREAEQVAKELARKTLALS